LGCYSWLYGVRCIAVIQTVRECHCGRNTRTVNPATWSSKALSRPVSPSSKRSATITVVCGRISTGNYRKLPPLRTCSLIRCCKVDEHLLAVRPSGRLTSPQALSTLSQKGETVAENSRCFLRQCHFSATVWTGLHTSQYLPV